MPWTGKDGRTLIFNVKFQHDGATPHSGKVNSEYCQWVEMLARKYPSRSIKIVTQPAQSPDLNTLDLGFFNSLAHLAYDTDPNSLSDLLDAVEAWYWDYDPDTLERVWQAQSNVYNALWRPGATTTSSCHILASRSGSVLVLYLCARL
jgi:hypothetical protein